MAALLDSEIQKKILAYLEKKSKSKSSTAYDFSYNNVLQLFDKNIDESRVDNALEALCNPEEGEGILEKASNKEIFYFPKEYKKKLGLKFSNLFESIEERSSVLVGGFVTLLVLLKAIASKWITVNTIGEAALIGFISALIFSKWVGERILTVWHQKILPELENSNKKAVAVIVTVSVILIGIVYIIITKILHEQITAIIVTTLVPAAVVTGTAIWQWVFKKPT